MQLKAVGLLFVEYSIRPLLDICLVDNNIEFGGGIGTGEATLPIGVDIWVFGQGESVRLPVVRHDAPSEQEGTVRRGGFWILQGKHDGK